jgi:hypothetical protein
LAQTQRTRTFVTEDVGVNAREEFNFALFGRVFFYCWWVRGGGKWLVWLFRQHTDEAICIVLCHGCSLLTFAPRSVIDESQIRELAFLGRCPTLFSQQSGEERPSGVEKSRHWLSTVTLVCFSTWGLDLYAGQTFNPVNPDKSKIKQTNLAKPMLVKQKETSKIGS